MNPSLGPQCYTCRKRQVKCDSTTPTCQRCTRDERACQGYQKPIKVFRYDPKAYGKRAPPRPCDRSSVAAAKSEAPSECSTSLQRCVPTTDSDYLALLESFRYYEVHILPGMFPTALFGEPPGVDRQTPWHEIPPLVQNCLTVAFRSMHNDFDALIGSSNKELCFYRGRSLKKLQEALPNAVEDPYGVALSCILLLVGAELKMPPYTAWLLHFQAAQRLIELRGGMAVCLKTLPQAEQILMHFLYQDVLTGTSASSDTLRNDAGALAGYPDILARIGPDHVFNPLFFPNELLIALAKINFLRIRHGRTSAEDFMAVWQEVETFCPEEWTSAGLGPPSSARINANLPGDPSSIKALVLYGECCQLATLIYLGLSCQHLAPTTLPRRLLEIYQDLVSHITSILEAAEQNVSGSLHSQLWRFLRWPVFVAAYARTGWFSLCDVGSSNGYFEKTAHQTMPKWASGLTEGACRFKMAKEYLETIRWRRSLYRTWTWDDGFPERCCLFITKGVPGHL